MILALVVVVKNIRNVVDVRYQERNLGMEELNAAIKKSFGEKMKICRKNAGYSRAKLAVELGVSSKTIQSWETGRTFPENMSLVPIIEKKLGFFVPDILGQTVREEVAKVGGPSAPAESVPPETTEEAPRKKIVRRAAVVEESGAEEKEEVVEEAPEEIDEV
jgi:transcriptional regulator with XRE-family HTH domain